MAEELKDLRGTMTRIHTASPTFTAGKMLPVADDVTKRTEVSVAGRFFARVGEYVHLRGVWVNHKFYGRQLQVAERIASESMDVSGLASWLAAHGQGIGLGPVRAEKIAREFGENFGGILSDNPEQVAIFAKLPLEAVKQLAERFRDHKDEMAVATKLAAWGLTQSQIHTLYDRFKGSIVAILEEDPYLILGYVDGLGFKRVDDVARRLGTPELHPGRLAAAVIHVLKEARDDGSTCLPRSECLQAAERLLDSANDGMGAALEQAVDGLLADGKRLKAWKTTEAEAGVKQEAT